MLAAGMMMTAARTAPKTRGADRLTIICITGDELLAVAKQMRIVAERDNIPFFERDAACVEASQAMVVIGSSYVAAGLNCGFCGFDTCALKQQAGELIPCVFNTNDLGIAVGSAVSVAADLRVDSRVMYSAGRASIELEMMGKECRMALAIPLSCSGKSPYFDR